MEVTWVSANQKPDVSVYGITSTQLVLKLTSGFLVTGYWSENLKDWVYDGVVGKNERVAFWLKGL